MKDDFREQIENVIKRSNVDLSDKDFNTLVLSFNSEFSRNLKNGFFNRISSILYREQMSVLKKLLKDISI